MAYALKDNKIVELEKNEQADVELRQPSSFFSSHINLIPLQNNVQGPRLFYGARFINQAMPLTNPEAPLVQNLSDDDSGRSFDEIYGRQVGAVFAGDDDDDAEVQDNDGDRITLKKSDGTTKVVPLYKSFPFNRKSAIYNTSALKPGDRVKAGQLLAKSNYTDDKGTLAMGTNARVGLVPYKGWSMDDAIVLSEGFAKKLASDHSYMEEMEFDGDTKGGKGHFVSLFPEKFTRKQLEIVDDKGVVVPGTVLNNGDPMILATAPKAFNSTVGRLSKVMRQARSDRSTTWGHDEPGIVTDVAHTKDGVKVVVQSTVPTRQGDKVVFRSGQKGIVSKIIPDEQMPRTVDGKPLEVLLNPLGVPSRVNNSIIYELMLGKLAKARGEAIKVPGFNKKGDKRYEEIIKMLDEAGLSDLEEVFDPTTNRKLENPITVGDAYILKLHHVAECYDDQTEVLTDSGWKLWKDVDASDKLATSDNDGQCLLFEKPLHLMEYDYDGLLCAFSSRYVDYAVTPNHNMWQKPYYGQRTFTLRQASAIHGSRFKVKQFGLIPTCPGGPGVFTLGAADYDWDDFCEFTGWWVSEGCVNSSKSGVVVYQSQSANPEKVAHIEALLNRMGLNWSYYKVYGDVMGFSINEKAFADYFAHYGTHSQFKRVPRELLTGQLSGCRRMITSMMAGDGNYYKKQVSAPTGRYTTTSKQLADDFQELCIRVGWGSIVQGPYERGGNTLPHWVSSFTVSRDCSQVDGDRNSDSFKMLPYSGKVYCAEMLSGLLYVRRNGKPMLCGNSKASSRSQGSYDLNEQPVKGGGEGAQSKRFSGLEVHSMLSAGAYKTLREASTLRGQKNDEYWRQLRAGLNPHPPGEPFVWNKFRALLEGAGMSARSIGGGKMRLGPMTDDELDSRKPLEVKNGKMVDLGTMEPEHGGLFDHTLVGSDKWGVIKLPHHVPNPAFENHVAHLLGITKDQLREVLAGRMELPDRR